MPRPKKWRRVCALPGELYFGPTCSHKGGPDQVEMLVEEYEVIRLMDYEGLNQEACAERMGVARTTVQRMYTDARRKLAEALIEGRHLHINGGDYRLCSLDESIGGCGGCQKKKKGVCHAKSM